MSRAIKLLLGEESWGLKYISELRSTPWNQQPKDLQEEEVVVIPYEELAQTEDKEVPLEKIYVRDVRVEKRDFRDFGYTKGSSSRIIVTIPRRTYGTPKSVASVWLRPCESEAMQINGNAWRQPTRGRRRRLANRMMRRQNQGPSPSEPQPTHLSAHQRDLTPRPPSPSNLPVDRQEGMRKRLQPAFVQLPARAPGECAA